MSPSKGLCTESDKIGCTKLRIFVLVIMFIGYENMYIDKKIF